MNNPFQVTIPEFILNWLDTKCDPVTKKFLVRTWNSFFSFLLPLIAGAVLSYISANDLPLKFSSLLSLNLLDSVAGAVIINILGAVVNGAGAGIREQDRQKEFQNSEGL